MATESGKVDERLDPKDTSRQQQPPIQNSTQISGNINHNTASTSFTTSPPATSELSVDPPSNLTKYQSAVASRVEAVGGMDDTTGLYDETRKQRNTKKLASIDCGRKFEGDQTREDIQGNSSSGLSPLNSGSR